MTIRLPASIRNRPPLALAVAFLALAAATFGATLGAGGTGGAAAPRKPNIVVIMTDDQTVESMRAMPLTRRLIGRAGVTFTRSFATFPLCCPSRATFLTGQYAHNHRVLGNGPPHGGYSRFRPSAGNALPVWLRRAGYDTIHVGKYLNGYRGGHVPAGWSDWHGAADPSTYGMWGYTLNENGTTRTYGQREVEDPALYQTDVYRDKAVSAIRRRARGTRPFFLNLAFLAPHLEGAAPVRPAPRHRGRFAGAQAPRTLAFDEANVTDKPPFVQQRGRLTPGEIRRVDANYTSERASLLAVDEAVAAVIDALRDAGELENTYVMFTSDNGFMHGEHRLVHGKFVAYEPSVRVPLLIRGPGIPAGRSSAELAGNIDLAPTIVGLARARARRVMDGRSLLPFAKRPTRRTRRALVLEGTSAARLDEDVEENRRNRPSVPYQAIRTARFKYVAYTDGARELYDLARDPDELTSQHRNPRYARTLAYLRRQLSRVRACRGSACRRAVREAPLPASR